MKNTLIAQLVVLGCMSVAFADGASCPSTQTCSSPGLEQAQKPTRGYVVELKKNAKGETLALVEELGVVPEFQTRTYRTLGELKCTELTTLPNPDEVVPVTICQDPAKADAGYTLELLAADFAGIRRARLYEESFRGRFELGTLDCRGQVR